MTAGPARFALGEDTDPSGADDDRPPPPREKLVTSDLTKSWLRPSSGHDRQAAVRGNRLRTRGRWAAALRAFLRYATVWKGAPMNTDDVSRDLARAFPAAPGD